MWDRQVEVIVQRPGHPERRLVLSQGVTHLGRAEDNELVLPDIGVSRKHARIVVEAGGVQIEDLGSGNGTWHKGNRVEQHSIEDGDQIFIDPFILSFRMHKRAPSARSAFAHDLPREIASDEQARARLVTLSGARMATSYPLRKESTSMGRSDARDIVLYDPSSSRHQVDIVLKDGVFWLQDLKSANGTFVNGERASERQLRHGDRIRVGSTELRFEDLSLQVSDDDGDLSPAPERRARSFLDAPTAQLSAAEQPAAPRVPHNEPTQQLRLPPPPRAQQPSGRMRGLVFAGVGLFALFCLVTSGLLIAYALRGPAEPAAAAVAVAPPARDPAVSAEVEAAMDEGRRLFDRHAYLDAASRFALALKKDPNDETAERMVYLACENLALQTMRDALMVRVTPEEERREVLRRALTLADQAATGKSSPAMAREALERAQLFFPSDPRLVAALARVQPEAPPTP